MLRGVGTGGPGLAALAGLGVTASGTPAHAAFPSDDDILNFEYLGAELYLHALTGTGTRLGAGDTSGTGTRGTVMAGSPVPFFTAVVGPVVEKLAADELAHVRFLRKRLGSSTIAEPSINLSTSFNTVAVAIGLIPPGQTLNPFKDEVSLLLAAYVLEDVCVTALAGSAASLTNPADVTSAAGLLGTEAAQASAVRLLLSVLGQGALTDAISTLRADASGAADDVGTSIPGNRFNFVSNDSNGLVFARTPAQVLNIAYAGGAASDFGFFPNKVNGAIS